MSSRPAPAVIDSIFAGGAASALGSFFGTPLLREKNLSFALRCAFGGGGGGCSYIIEFGIGGRMDIFQASRWAMMCSKCPSGGRPCDVGLKILRTQDGARCQIAANNMCIC